MVRPMRRPRPPPRRPDRDLSGRRDRTAVGAWGDAHRARALGSTSLAESIEEPRADIAGVYGCWSARWGVPLC
jgi:hypothetical protein